VPFVSQRRQRLPKQDRARACRLVSRSRASKLNANSQSFDAMFKPGFSFVPCSCCASKGMGGFVEYLYDAPVNNVQQPIRDAAEKGRYRYRWWKVNDLEQNEGCNGLQLSAMSLR
jgi:hypothetical protein